MSLLRAIKLSFTKVTVVLVLQAGTKVEKLIINTSANTPMNLQVKWFK